MCKKNDCLPSIFKKIKYSLSILLKIYIYLTSIIITFVGIYVLFYSVKTGKSYCIIMNSEKDYNGEYMRTCIKPEKIFYGDTKQCILWDKEYDNNDGDNQGKVRWIECRKFYPDSKNCMKEADF